MRMQIRFADISTSGNRYEVDKPLFLCDDETVHCDSLQARCILRKKDETHVEMHGHIQATVSLQCDSCLEPFVAEIDRDMEFLLEVEEEKNWQIKELECSVADLDTLVLETPLVDLEDILRQQVLLTLPIKQVCRIGCKGLCPQCGANLNEVKCRCKQTGESSPFAVLAKLKKEV